MPDFVAPIRYVDDEPFVDEREHRLAAFDERFAFLSGSRTIVYGSGENARDLLERWKGTLDLVAVVDDEHAGETVAGHAVMTLSEALSLGADLVVIAARIASTREVHARIADVCREHGVDVFDLYGNNLDGFYERVSAQGQGTGLDALAESCDLLCLDANDALFLAPCWSVDDAPAARALALIRRLHDRVLARGGTVVFFSDGTHGESHERIAAALVHEGWNLDQGLHCLRSQRFATHVGILRFVRDAHPGERMLAVGTNWAGSAFAPGVHGFDGWWIELEGGRDVPPAAEEPLFFATADERDRGLASLADVCAHADDRLVLELVERHLCATDAGIDAQSRFVCCGLAPVLTGYLTWLASRLRRERFSGVLFSARDGHLPLRLYKAMAKEDVSLPPAVYLPISRKAVVMPFVDEPRVQTYIAWFGKDLGPFNVLHQVCGLSDDSIDRGACDDALRAEDGMIANLTALAAHRKALAACAAQAREGWMALFKRIGLDPQGRYLLVDAAGGGHSQGFFGRIAPFEVGNACTVLRYSMFAQRGVPIEAYFCQDDDYRRRYLHGEAFLSAPEPSLSGLTAAGEPVYGPEIRSQRDIDALMLAHDLVAGFFDEFLARRQTDEPVSRTLVDRLFKLYDDPGIDMLFEDDWRGSVGLADKDKGVV